MITRRHAFGAAVAAGCIAALPATAPARGQSLPAAYRRRFGDVEVTALCDGYTGFQQGWITGAEPAAMAELARRAFLPEGPGPTAVNAFAVRAGGRTVLIDAGAGRFWDPANCGRLAGPMAIAGIAPEQVDAVLLTHLHADHAGGLLTAEDAARYPRAELLMAEAEAGFWLDAGARARAPERLRPGFDRAAAWCAPYAARSTRFAPGARPAPGIEAVAMPGHTPGHTGLLVGDGAERLLIIGDLVQVGPFQFARPDWNTVLDLDRDAATAARRRVLDMAAADRLLIAGSHLAFPGLGYVTREGNGYGFTPAPWLVGA
jgi:glyoxylase-like metal-dependent hydrolase (beta-lactamase superfamily II)